MISVEDRLAIRELLALYGYIIDERQFSRTGEIFTADARYDVTDVIISEDSDGTVRVICEGLGLGPDGQVGSLAATTTVAETQPAAA